MTSHRETSVQGTRYRLDEAGKVSVFRDGRWRPASLGPLARAHDVDHPLWVWLRENGVRRPSPSGPSGQTIGEQARAARGQARVVLRVSTAAKDALSARAADRGCTVSQLVERWILKE